MYTNHAHFIYLVTCAR